MIKLLTLDNVSAFSSDSIFKICLTLDRFGLTDDKVLSFSSYNELFNEAETSLAKGDFVMIATENSELLKAKHMLSSRFSIEEESSSVIAEAISKANHSEQVDMYAHCDVLKGSKVHLSADGLYSAMSVPCSNGLCTLLPLDFERLDAILEDYVSSFLVKKEEQKPQEEESYFRPVASLVEKLYENDKTAAIATGTAAMNIYNLYNKIDHFSTVLQFVDIVDEEKEEVKEKEEAKPIKGASEEEYDSLLADLLSDGSEEALTSEKSFDEAESEEEKAEEPKEETVSEKTVRHAKEAKNSMSSDFGAAISELCEERAEDGSVRYVAYVAVADEKTTKTKVVATTKKEETELLLQHTVTVLAETIAKKLDSAESGADSKESGKKAELPFSKNMIIFAAVVLIAAIVFPMSLAKFMYGGENNTPTLPNIVTGESLNINQVDLQVSDPMYSVTAAAETTTNPFGLPGGAESNTLESGYKPTEPAATDVSVSVTETVTPSNSGTFTFYVFGYGHGAGLSQTGANYLASQGWNYAQILANYYYGTTLVSGDTYPKTIKYNGQDYKTRDFLAGVIEAEMGGNYLPEALKAQTVAAYTFAKYYAFNVDTNKMAFKSDASNNCYEAVDEIMKRGVFISYNNTTALTPFFATSAGKTTSFYNAFGQYDLPYLQGGRPSYGDYNSANFKQVKTYTSADLKSLIQAHDPTINLSGDPSTWISILSHDTAVSEDIGYVSSVRVGGKVMSGNDFRIKVMGGEINSHCFMVSYTPDK